MKYRPLGKSGIRASVVGLGTWAIGGWMWGGQDESDSIEAIRAAVGEGTNLIDTAPAYGLGVAEEVVGKAVQGRRGQVVIATKCGLVWDTDKGTRFFDESGHAVHRYLGPESVRRELERSLARLRTDYVDLYQTHWQDKTTPIQDTMGELLRLRERGMIRAIGVCNVNEEEMDVYTRSGRVDCDQERYSMLDRQHETDMLPYCETRGIAVLAYSPLAQGLLTGKVGPDREFSGDDQRQHSLRFTAENRGKVAAMLAEFRPIAERHKISLTQLVIAWTVAQPGLTHALVGARNAGQAKENAGGGEVELSEEDLKTMAEAIRGHAAGIP